MVREGRILAILRIARAERDGLHATKGHDLGLTESESARKVGVLGKHVLIVVVPEEFGLHKQGDLHVARD